jgi:hypothetical protein
VSAPREAHGLLSMNMYQPSTGVCQVNKEPDRREMKPTVLQVGGMGVPFHRQADRAQREEADLRTRKSVTLLHDGVENHVIIRHCLLGVKHTKV